MTREEYGNAYQRGFDHTVRFMLSRCGMSRDRAMETAQAAWARGWERLYQLREDGMVLTWVNTIALNVHRTVLRKDKVYQPMPELRGETGINVAAIDVARMLKRCHPRDRALLEQQIGGATVEEIARTAGVTETAIRIRLLRARRAIRARADIKLAQPLAA